MWLQYDYGDGPVVDGVKTVLFVAWLAWSIAQNTGVDMSELKISERAVRSISAAAATA